MARALATVAPTSEGLPAAPFQRRADRPHPAPAAGVAEPARAGAAALANPARRWRRLIALAGYETEAAALVAAALAERRGGGDPVQVLDRVAVAALLPDGAVHQGFALEAEPLAPADLDDVLRAAD